MIEAQVSPLDIDVVEPGLPAQVRLTAFKQRRTPTLDGRVVQVSADQPVRRAERRPHIYKADVEIDPPSSPGSTTSRSTPACRPRC